MLNISDDKNELVKYLKCSGEMQRELQEKAMRIKHSHSNNMVYVRGVLEISDYCRCKCKFCGNAAYVKDKIRYRMNYDEIKTQIDYAKNLGLDVVHIASGEDKGFDFDVIYNSVKYILDQGMFPELAIGKLDTNQYEKLYDLGARRIILKFETSDKELFKSIKECGAELDDLLSLIKELIDRGFEVGSGNIIGLPGQSIESVVDDLLLVKELNVKMASTSVFMPNSESMFSDEKPGDANIALNYLALLRCIKENDNISIPANSTFGAEGKKNALRFVSNELSLNITPARYQNIYSIYEGPDRIKSSMEAIKDYIKESGCELATIKKVIYK